MSKDFRKVSEEEAMCLSEGKAFRQKSASEKKMNQWFTHVIAKKLAKQRPLLFLLERDLTTTLIEFSILTCLWSEKGAAARPYCISVWVGKKATLSPGESFPVSRHTAWRLEGGLDFRPHSFLSPVSLCRTQLAWHYANVQTDFPVPWNNFSFNRKRSSLFTIIYIYIWCAGAGANLILKFIMRK